MNQLQRTTLVAIVCIAIWTSVIGLPVLPVLDSSSGIDNDTIEELKASLNNSPRNLYVVKAVVYEIGILTEEDDNSTSIESQERVDLTFYDAHVNSSHINLGNIPLPIQTNVSGQILTGIAPVNIGAFSSAQELLSTLPLTGTIVNLTHSDTAFFQLTTHNVSENEKPKVLSNEEIAKIPYAATAFSTQKHFSSNEAVPTDETD